MFNIVVHGLSIFEVMKGQYKIRSTIRIGQVEQGQALTYTASCGDTRTLKIIECIDGPSRHTTLIVEGDDDTLNEFKSGSYLYG